MGDIIVTTTIFLNGIGQAVNVPVGVPYVVTKTDMIYLGMDPEGQHAYLVRHWVAA